jgi:hypothetical protein
MAIEAHLAELEKRHEALKLEISEALTHPSTDDLRIAELKRRKLQVKDEITRLKQEFIRTHRLYVGSQYEGRPSGFCSRIAP